MTNVERKVVCVPTYTIQWRHTGVWRQRPKHFRTMQQSGHIIPRERVLLWMRDCMRSVDILDTQPYLDLKHG